MQPIRATTTSTTSTTTSTTSTTTHRSLTKEEIQKKIRENDESVMDPIVGGMRGWVISELKKAYLDRVPEVNLENMLINSINAFWTLVGDDLAFFDLTLEEFEKIKNFTSKKLAESINQLDILEMEDPNGTVNSTVLSVVFDLRTVFALLCKVVFEKSNPPVLGQLRKKIADSQDMATIIDFKNRALPLVVDLKKLFKEGRCHRGWLVTIMDAFTGCIHYYDEGSNSIHAIFFPASAELFLYEALEDFVVEELKLLPQELQLKIFCGWSGMNEYAPKADEFFKNISPKAIKKLCSVCKQFRINPQNMYVKIKIQEAVANLPKLVPPVKKIHANASSLFILLNTPLSDELKSTAIQKALTEVKKSHSLDLGHIAEEIRDLVYVITLEQECLKHRFDLIGTKGEVYIGASSDLNIFEFFRVFFLTFPNYSNNSITRIKEAGTTINSILENLLVLSPEFVKDFFCIFFTTGAHDIASADNIKAIYFLKIIRMGQKDYEETIFNKLEYIAKEILMKIKTGHMAQSALAEINRQIQLQQYASAASPELSITIETFNTFLILILTISPSQWSPNIAWGLSAIIQSLENDLGFPTRQPQYDYYPILVPQLKFMLALYIRQLSVEQAQSLGWRKEDWQIPENPKIYLPLNLREIDLNKVCDNSKQKFLILFLETFHRYGCNNQAFAKDVSRCLNWCLGNYEAILRDLFKCLVKHLRAGELKTFLLVLASKFELQSSASEHEHPRKIIFFLQDDLFTGIKLDKQKIFYLISYLHINVFKGIDLGNSDLSGSNFSRIIFYSAILRGANLTNANLVGTNLVNANLTNANLTGADLTNANLTGASLMNANLTGANLTNTNFFIANLSRANFTGANLTGTILANAIGIISIIFNDATLDMNDLIRFMEAGVKSLNGVKLIGPFLGFDFNDIELARVDFEKADFAGMTLSKKTIGCLMKAGCCPSKFKDIKLTGGFFRFNFALLVNLPSIVFKNVFLDETAVISFLKAGGKLQKGIILRGNFEGVTFKGIDFSRVEFNDAIGVDLEGATLDREAVISFMEDWGLSLEGAILKGSFDGVNFSNIDLTRVTCVDNGGLRGAILDAQAVVSFLIGRSKVSLIGTTLSGDFERVNLNGVNLSDVIFKRAINVNLDGAILNFEAVIAFKNDGGKFLKGARLSGEFSVVGNSIKLGGMDFTGVDFKSATLDAYFIDKLIAETGCRSFKGVKLIGFSFGISLSGIDLTNANLSGITLSKANLSSVNLTGANLTRVDLSFANLTNANLSGANLTRANLSGANLTNANLSGANLTDAYLSYAIFNGTNLDNAINFDTRTIRGVSVNPEISDDFFADTTVYESNQDSSALVEANEAQPSVTTSSSQSVHRIFRIFPISSPEISHSVQAANPSLIMEEAKGDTKSKNPKTRGGFFANITFVSESKQGSSALVKANKAQPSVTTSSSQSARRIPISSPENSHSVQAANLSLSVQAANPSLITAEAEGDTKSKSVHETNSHNATV